MSKTKTNFTKGAWVKTLFIVYWTSFVFLGFFTLIGVGSKFQASDAANPNASPDITTNIGNATTNASGGVGFDVYVCDILLPAAGYLVGALTVLMIVLAGVIYATSQGSGSGELSIGTSKQMILAALTGALLYVMGTVLLGNCGIGESSGLIERFLSGSAKP
jgi:hypothetical protein